MLIVCSVTLTFYAMHCIFAVQCVFFSLLSNIFCDFFVPSHMHAYSITEPKSTPPRPNFLIASFLHLHFTVVNNFNCTYTLLLRSGPSRTNASFSTTYTLTHTHEPSLQCTVFVVVFFSSCLNTTLFEITLTFWIWSRVRGAYLLCLSE